MRGWQNCATASRQTPRRRHDTNPETGDTRGRQPRHGLDTRRRALGGVRMSQESSLQTDGDGFTTQQVLQLTRPAIVTPSLPPQRPAHGPTADSGDETSPRTGFTLTRDDQFGDPHGLSRGRHFAPPPGTSSSCSAMRRPFGQARVGGCCNFGRGVLPSCKGTQIRGIQRYRFPARRIGRMRRGEHESRCVG